MTAPIRVLVADDHPMFRQGLSDLIANSVSTELVGEAEDGQRVVDLAAQLEPDVIVMDLRMPGLTGIDATRAILAARPRTVILVLTMMDDDSSVFAAMRAGASGYVLKGSGSEEIMKSIELVAHGVAVFGAPIASRIVTFFASSSPGRTRSFPELTPREFEVFEQLSGGLDNGAIARRLGLSEKTVRNNVSSVFAKLRVADRAAAVAKARDAGVGEMR